MERVDDVLEYPLDENVTRAAKMEKIAKIKVTLSFDKALNEFSLTLIDMAKAFNPLLVNNPGLGEISDNHQIGGLGILIVKSVMDEASYERINHKNVLVLRKRF